MTESDQDKSNPDLVHDLQTSLEEVAGLRGELVELVQQAKAELDRICEEAQMMAKQVDEKQDELASKEGEVKQLAERVQTSAEAQSQRESLLREEQQKSADLAAQLAAVEAERDEQRTKLDSVAAEIDSFSETLELLQSTQDELSRTRTELYAVRSEGPTADENLRSELSELRAENDRLHAELKKTAEHVGQLNATVERQTTELSSFRKRWADELGAVRADLTEAKESDLKQLPPPAAVVEENIEVASGEPKDPVNVVETVAAEQNEQDKFDPVVGSVLAEFQSLES